MTDLVCLCYLLGLMRVQDVDRAPSDLYRSMLRLIDELDRRDGPGTADAVIVSTGPMEGDTHG